MTHYASLEPVIRECFGKEPFMYTLDVMFDPAMRYETYASYISSVERRAIKQLPELASTNV